MLTDDEARLRDRDYGRLIAVQKYPDRVLCEGYPGDHYCIVLLTPESGRTLCRGCTRDRDAAQRDLFQQAAGMPSVADVLADLHFDVDSCGCGGDKTAPFHDQSWLHIQWMRNVGRG